VERRASRDASRFYHDTLGFDKTVWDYPGALFLAAGGYHHHVGTNTWVRNALAPPISEARLLEWTIELPTVPDVEALAASCDSHDVPYVREAQSLLVRDLWGTTVRISPFTTP
jgi:catechol 2,3-dioxygenase